MIINGVSFSDEDLDVWNLERQGKEILGKQPLYIIQLAQRIGLLILNITGYNGNKQKADSPNTR